MKRILFTLSEKWPEYLIEAVVIIASILGAIALENWNEDRKEGEKEAELLVNIKSDLEEARIELDGLIRSNSKNVRLLKDLMEAAKSGADYHPSMDTAFSRITVWTSPFLKSRAYESVKEYGLEFIDTPDLKDQLIHLYEFRFAQIVDDYDKSEWILAQSVSNPYFTGRLERGLGVATPTDYEKLISEPQFRANLSHIISLREYGVNLGKKTNEEIALAIELINKEIQ